MPTIDLARGQLKLHRGQRTVVMHPARYKCVVAGRRWGKTQVAKVALFMAAASAKNQLIWYVAPTYRMAKSIMWRELRRSVPNRWVKRVNETDLTMTLVNGTIIECKGADKPDTLRGVGLHFMVIDEAQDIREATWEEVLGPTVVTTGGRALLIGTPKSYNWLYDKWRLGQRGDTFKDKDGRTIKNAWKSWQYKTIDSPFVPVEEIEAKRAEMDPKSFQQEFEASFVSMSGRVYYGFDRTVHVGDYPFNPDLPVWVGMDFNVDPMSCVVMQEQPDGTVWIVREWSVPDSHTDAMADELSRAYHRHMRLNQVTIFPDPAGAARTHTTGHSDFDILRDKGFKRVLYRRKHPPVRDRVNSVNRMLMGGDGEVRLRVDRSCAKVISAFEQTSYKPKTSIVDKSMGVEHAADALGYCLEYKFPIRKVVVAGLSV